MDAWLPVRLLYLVALFCSLSEARPSRKLDSDVVVDSSRLKRISRRAAENEEELALEDSYESTDEHTNGNGIHTTNNGTVASSASLSIPAWYDKLQVPKPLEPPPNETFPLNVRLTLDVRNVAVQDENEVISLHCDVSLTWEDKVIFDANHNRSGLFPYGRVYVALNPAFLNRIWTPDVILENLEEVKLHKIVQRAKKLIYLKGGRFIYKFRATFQVSCDFALKYYPADTQKCKIQISTFAHPPTEVILVWDVLLFDPPNDPNFDFDVISLVENERCDEPKPREPTWYAEFEVLARRKISYQLMQTYVPSFLYIAITWLCFLIPRSLTEGRVAVAMTTLLTLTSMFASVRESTPSVSYVKAIDIWIVSCIVFVFCTLLHFAILLWTRVTHMSDEELAAVKVTPTQQQKRIMGYGIAVVEFVEANSFIIIAIMLSTFNISYWTWLFTESSYFHWNASTEPRLYNEAMSISTCNH